MTTTTFLTFVDDALLRGVERAHNPNPSKDDIVGDVCLAFLHILVPLRAQLRECLARGEEMVRLEVCVTGASRPSPERTRQRCAVSSAQRQ